MDLTLASSSTLKLDSSLSKSEKINAVAVDLATKLKSLKQNKFIFDRGNFVFKGNLKTFADSLRSNGVEL